MAEHFALGPRLRELGGIQGPQLRITDDPDPPYTAVAADPALGIIGPLVLDGEALL